MNWKNMFQNERSEEIVCWLIAGVLFCLAITAGMFVLNFIISTFIQLNNL